MLTIGSLCTGYGGLDLAAEMILGHLDRRFHAEIDPDASTVLAAHHPGVPNLDDITAVDWRTVPPVDVLTAGFPCQSMSMAGKRRGSDDERFLWPEVARAVGVLRPVTLLVENVPGLLTIEAGGVFSMLLADLHRFGYHVSWTTVGACKVGACHHRHRVFLHATLTGRSAPDRQPLAWRDGGTGPWVGYETTLFGGHEPFGDWPAAGTMTDGYVWTDSADPCGANGVTTLPIPTGSLGDRWGSPSAETAQRRMFKEGRRNLEDAVALLPTPRVSAIRTSRGAMLRSSSAPSLEQALEIARGELPRELMSWDEAPPSWRPDCVAPALLPTPTARDATRGKGWADTETGRPLSEVIAALLPTPLATDAEGGPGRRNSHGHPKLTGAIGLLPTPRASDADKGGPNQRGSSGDWALPAAVQPSRFGGYEAAVRRHERILGGPVPEPTEPGRSGRPRLAAAFTEWMQALPSGYLTDHIGRAAAIRCAGNGVNPPQAAHAFRLLALPGTETGQPA